LGLFAHATPEGVFAFLFSISVGVGLLDLEYNYGFTVNLCQEIFKDNLYFLVVVDGTGKPASTPIGEDAQLSALRQVVKKEEASVEMKQRDENFASYADTAPATEVGEEKILANKEAVRIKWETLHLQFIKVLGKQIHAHLPLTQQELPINFNLLMWSFYGSFKHQNGQGWTFMSPEEICDFLGTWAVKVFDSACSSIFDRAWWSVNISNWPQE